MKYYPWVAVQYRLKGPCTKSFHDRASCLLVPATQFKRIETTTSIYTLTTCQLSSRATTVQYDA